jgi:peroxiredoxin Q/BCP
MTQKSIEVGERFPTFTLRDQRGQEFSLDAALGSGPVVIFFYPKDDTAGCTKEACGFRDAWPELQAAGAQVVGISSDDTASHERFAGKYGLTYPLLSDTGGALRRKVGVPRALLGLADGRVTYVLDRDGVVRYAFDSMLGVTKHVDHALATVRSLKGAG